MGASDASMYDVSPSPVVVEYVPISQQNRSAEPRRVAGGMDLALFNREPGLSSATSPETDYYGTTDQEEADELLWHVAQVCKEKMSREKLAARFRQLARGARRGSDTSASFTDMTRVDLNTIPIGSGRFSTDRNGWSSIPSTPLENRSFILISTSSDPLS